MQQTSDMNTIKLSPSSENLTASEKSAAALSSAASSSSHSLERSSSLNSLTSPGSLLHSSSAPDLQNLGTSSLSASQVNSALSASQVNSASRNKLSAENVEATVEGLKRLISAGSWRAVLRLADKCIASSKYPHDILQFRLCRIFAQVKMRSYKTAADEIEAIISGGQGRDTSASTRDADRLSQSLTASSLNVSQLGTSATNAVPPSPPSSPAPAPIVPQRDLLSILDDTTNSYQQHPNVYKGLRGSMLPFTLLLLRAELPYFLKASQSLDPLYELLALCRREIAALKMNDTKLTSIRKPKISVESLTPLVPSLCPTFSVNSNVTVDDIFYGDVKETLQLWLQREQRLMLIIATRLAIEKEYPLALQMLSDVVQKFGQDPIFVSAIGRIHLMMGNIKGAGMVFREVEALAGENNPLVHLNRGFLAVSTDKYNIAIEHFERALELEPNNLLAANNRAICYLYVCDLNKAIQSLEELIKRDPEHNLQESVVFNLCTLYDLKSDNSNEKKKGIMSMVAKYGADSFDLSVLKLT